MTIRLKPGQQLQLPSGNVVLVLELMGREAVCTYVAWSRLKGEIVFSQAWLARSAVVLDRGPNR